MNATQGDKESKKEGRKPGVVLINLYLTMLRIKRKNKRESWKQPSLAGNVFVLWTCCVGSAACFRVDIALRLTQATACGLSRCRGSIQSLGNWLGWQLLAWPQQAAPQCAPYVTNGRQLHQNSNLSIANTRRAARQRTEIDSHD